MSDLDCDHSRSKILFSCDTVIDFENGTARKAMPEDRLGHMMACSAEMFASSGPTTLFDDIETWAKTGNPSLPTSEVGQRIVEQLRKLRSECEVLGVVYDFAGH